MVDYYPHSETRYEMKRLCVRPEERGHALGDCLIESIVDYAGYRTKSVAILVPKIGK